MMKMLTYGLLIIAAALLVSCGGEGGGGAGGGTTGGSATLQWSVPTEDVDGSPITVEGYIVYYGTESEVYTNSIDVGNVTTYTLSGLPTGATYYFVITAYDNDGVESEPTDPQSKAL